MGERVDQVKAHIARHRVKYAVATGLVIGGVTVYVVMRYRSAVPTIDIPEAEAVVNTVTTQASVNAGVAYKPTVNANTFNTVVAHFPERSTPSTVVQCIEDGWMEPSISQAAERAGISRTQLSAAVNGRVEAIRGKHYVKVPKLDPDIGEELIKVAKDAA